MGIIKPTFYEESKDAIRTDHSLLARAALLLAAVGVCVCFLGLSRGGYSHLTVFLKFSKYHQGSLVIPWTHSKLVRPGDPSQNKVSNV